MTVRVPRDGQGNIDVDAILDSRDRVPTIERACCEEIIALRRLLHTAREAEAGQRQAADVFEAERNQLAAEMIMARKTVAALREALGDRAQEIAGSQAFVDAHKGVRAERDALAKRVAALGFDTPWPATEILRRLADAADHLLGVHACDAHGYEGVTIARDEARRMADRLDGI